MRRSALPAAARPALSVIVPVHDVAPYLTECLRSVLDQSFTDVEVVVVEDGSVDDSRAIASEITAQDPRCRLVLQENRGLGAARNVGVRVASGTHLAFVDSDDMLPGGALETLMSRSLETGADITAGAVERFADGRRWPPEWVADVHDRPRSLTDVEDFLPLLRNFYSWDKVFRRDFWDAQGLAFREGVAYEDQPLVTQLLARAGSIEVVPDVVYLYRARQDRSSISQQTSTLPNLRDRITAWRTSHQALRDECSPTVQEAWLETLLNTHVHWYLTSAGTEDPAYWAELRDAVHSFADVAPAWIWRSLRPQQRVLIRLAALDRREDARRLIREDRAAGGEWPTSVQAGGILVHLPFLEDPDLDEELFLLSPEQVDLVHTIERIAWEVHGGRTVCRVTGWCYLAGVDLSRYRPVTTVLLRDGTGETEVFATSDHPTPVLPPPHTDPHSDYAPGGFSVDLPVEALRAAAGAGCELLVQVSVGGLTVSEPVTRLLRSGSAANVPAFTMPDGSRLRVGWSPGRTLRFRAEHGGVRVADLAVHGRTITGRLVDPSAAGEVECRAGERTGRAPVGTDGSFRLVLPDADPPSSEGTTGWRLRAGAAPGSLAPLVPLTEVDLGERHADGAVLVDTNRKGELRARQWRAGVVVDDVLVRPGGLVVRGRMLGPGQRLELGTRSEEVRSTTSRCSVDEHGDFETTLDLREPRFRFGTWPLPIGDHDLVATVHDGGVVVDVPVRASRRLGAGFPLALATELHEGYLVRGPDGGVRMSLQRPVGPARGRYRQHRLRTAPARPATSPAVLLRSGHGERSSGTAWSVHAALRRLEIDVPVHWAVRDPSVVIPDGAVPVVINSERWYELLASASLYVDDAPQPVHHVKPAGQTMVHVPASYPDPAGTGSTASPHRLHSLAARARDWDYLVSPSPGATPLLKEQFQYGGEILEVGTLRGDLLWSDEHGSVRAAVRASLGVGPEETAVVCHPGPHVEGAGEQLLDLVQRIAAAGERMVVLLRGEALPVRLRHRLVTAPHVVDVTAYPLVEDLCLAADVAVLGDSTWRFDIAVTGKPMIFLLPPGGARTPAHRFASTAPGPVVSDAGDVVAALGDLAAVRGEHRSAYRSFVAEHLPLDDGASGRRLVEAVAHRAGLPAAGPR